MENNKATQEIISAFEIDLDGSFAWIVKRTDGKYALACDSDANVGMLAEDAVVTGTEWHDSIKSLRAELTR